MSRSGPRNGRDVAVGVPADTAAEVRCDETGIEKKEI